MIKYNNNTINDWFFSTDNIIKVYRNNAICYYKIDSSSPSGQTPCFAVVNNISQYSDTEFEDVFNLADEKWYKLNNLNQYEEYGVYGSGRTITTYEGKLTIDGDYEYIYSGNSWVNVGEVSGSSVIWFDPKVNNAVFNVGHYWGNGYKMVWTLYLDGSYTSDRNSFWGYNNTSPIEFSFYSNGFFYDMHNPTSTSSPSVYTGDYSYRILQQNKFNSYENSTVLKFTLTYGTFKAEVEETGAVILTASTATTSQNWYNGLYQAKIYTPNEYMRAHIKEIQVYNANDVLVNDLTFVKNPGTTGSQEISVYDSVLDVKYDNTNSNTPLYHEESGGETIYPMYYPVIQNPPNNLVFSSMTEAEEYECPWVGMSAKIDGVKYVFSGDSQTGYEWVYNPSRLPVGYTEVEYVQNTSYAYLDIGFVPNQNTRIVADMQQVTENGFPRLWGAGEWNSANGININYEGGNLRISWFGQTSWTQITSVPNNFDRHVYDLNKNNLYVDETLVGSSTYTTKTAAASIGIFCEIRNNGQPPTSENNPQYWDNEYFKGKMYSFQVYNNGTLTRDLVPCVRDYDNKAGAYDLVNDVFYTVPTGYTTDTLIAGNPV